MLARSLVTGQLGDGAGEVTRSGDLSMEIHGTPAPCAGDARRGHVGQSVENCTVTA